MSTTKETETQFTPHYFVVGIHRKPVPSDVIEFGDEVIITSGESMDTLSDHGGHRPE